MNKDEFMCCTGDFIKHYKYYISKYEYDEDFFGDFQIILTNLRLFNIRFVKDKGQFFCDVKGNFMEWIDLNILMKVFDNNFQYNINFEVINSIEIIIDFFSDNIIYISEILSLKKRSRLNSAIKA